MLEVKTEKAGSEYVTPEGLEELKKRHSTAKPVVLKPAGEQGQFSGHRGPAARASSAIWPPNRRDVAKALDLPPMAVEDDPSLEGGWRAVRIELKRADPRRERRASPEDDRGSDSHARRELHLPVDRKPRRVGGRCRRVGQLPGSRLDPSKVRTVAYIPNEARSDAALVALACDQVVMHPRAVLGGSGAHQLSADEIADVQQSIRKSLAPRKGRSWSLMAAHDRPEP